MDRDLNKKEKACVFLSQEFGKVFSFVDKVCMAKREKNDLGKTPFPFIEIRPIGQQRLHVLFLYTRLLEELCSW